MKYPQSTVSQPLSEKQAERVERAVKTGKTITNNAYRNTIERLVKEVHRTHNGSKKSSVQR